MKPPAGAELFETPISTHWFDKSGIMFAISKPVERTVEHYKKTMELYSRFTIGGNRLLLVSFSDHLMPTSDEVRAYLIKEMPKYIKAQAIIIAAPMEISAMQTLLSFAFNGLDVSFFTNEKEAMDWIEKFR